MPMPGMIINEPRVRRGVSKLTYEANAVSSSDGFDMADAKDAYWHVGLDPSNDPAFCFKVGDCFTFEIL